MKILQPKKLFFSAITLIVFAFMLSVGCDDGPSIINDGSIGAFSKINKNIVNVIEVTASSYYKDDKPENTIDVDFSSKWAAKGSVEWIKYDLGESKDIESLDIFFSASKKMYYRFSIDLSINGINWEEVYRGTSRYSIDKFENFAFDTTLARYVRIKVYNYYQKDKVEIVEVEINAISHTDECNYGIGEEEYDKEYYSRKEYLEYTWKSYGCDDIDDFVKNVKYDTTPTGYCSKKAFKKATQKVISKIEKKCEEDCKSGDGREEYEDAYDSRESDLENSWKEYGCDDLDNFLKEAKHDKAPKEFCSEKAFKKATKDVTSDKEKECKDDGDIYNCKSGQGLDEYKEEYNSRKKDLENSWKKYSCETIDKFFKNAKGDTPPSETCAKEGFDKATKKVISDKEKECEDDGAIDDCKSEDGKKEYKKEYDSRKKDLEKSWEKYSCEKIDKFIKDTKRDTAPTGTCGKEGFDKATKKVISEIEKECKDLD